MGKKDNKKGKSTVKLNQKKYLILGVAVIFFSGLIFSLYDIAILNQTPKPQDEENSTILIYHTPTCNCCKGYIEYLKQKGYDVKSVLVSDPEIIEIKSKNNIPYSLWSCHTFIYKGYVFEGHLPLESIEDFLNNPSGKGLALPGMPPGSPGMGGIKTQPFEVLVIKDNLQYDTFGSY